VIAMSTEVILAAGYGVFLLVVALGLEWLARHSHRRSEAYRTAGFTFDSAHDHWLCPEGERLPRAHTDHGRRLVRYRASAQICNACPVKDDCTDSDDGREIAQPMDSWPRSEAGRFHRGISVMLLTLAAATILVVLVRNHEPAEVVVLSIALAPIAFALPRLLGAFRAAPSGEPYARSL